MPEENQTRYTIGVIQRGVEGQPDEIIAVCRTDKAAAQVAQALENVEPVGELVNACRNLLHFRMVTGDDRETLTRLLKPFDNQFRG